MGGDEDEMGIKAKEQKYREKLTDRMVNFSMSSLAVGCVRFPCIFQSLHSIGHFANYLSNVHGHW